MANVNFFITISHTYFKIPNRELTSFNKLDDSWASRPNCTLSLEFMNLLQNFHLAVIEYLYHGRRAVPLQTFTTGHSNRKLSIVTALSTTFTQCAPETTGKIAQNKGHFVVQGHSRSPILVPIESSYTASYQCLITY